MPQKRYDFVSYKKQSIFFLFVKQFFIMVHWQIMNKYDLNKKTVSFEATC